MIRTALTLLFSFFIFLTSYAQQDTVAIAKDSTKIKEAVISNSAKRIYKFNVKEEIGPPVWRKMQQAFEEANDWDADLILLHMKTACAQKF